VQISCNSDIERVAAAGHDVGVVTTFAHEVIVSDPKSRKAVVTIFSSAVVMRRKATADPSSLRSSG
jgi:hypothetical protein